LTCSARLLAIGSFGALAFAGCAAQHYQAATIVPTESAARLESTSFSDPSLAEFEKQHFAPSAAAWPPVTWDLETLSLAALYFNPEMQSARARVEEADATIISAGAKPNPTLSLEPGVPAPYLLSLDLDFPIETAGKRGHRIASANNLDRAAQFDLADAAWKVRSEVRTALLQYFVAMRTLDLLRSEQDLRTTQAKLLQQRFTAGEIPRLELDTAQIALAQNDLDISRANGQISQAKAALAAAIGIQLAALDGINFNWRNFDAPPSANSLSAQQIQRDAVLNRMDVQRALAQYAATESDLQIEIAKQYPDVQIGPGYAYEESRSYFTLGLSTTLPIFNRNQGPIAEAEARRREAAANFLQRQTQVIADCEQSFTAYTSALNELTESDRSLGSLQQTRLQMIQRAVQAGEEDPLAVNGVQMESNAVARARLEALARAQTALGHLEDAVQRPLDPWDAFPAAASLIQSVKDQKP
jgi:cobalt-zinc-cadmium efflux system outer membrane protein